MIEGLGVGHCDGSSIILGVLFASRPGTRYTVCSGGSIMNVVMVGGGVGARDRLYTRSLYKANGVVASNTHIHNTCSNNNQYSNKQTANQQQ
jgi:hypothetical protein